MIRTLLGLLLLWSLFRVKVIDGYGNGAHCVQFGQGTYHDEWDYGNGRIHSRTGMWTIATKRFDAKFLTSLSSTYKYYRTDRGPYLDTHWYNSFIARDNDRCPWPFAPPCSPRPNWPSCTKPADGEVKIKPCVANTEVRMNMYLVKQDGRILQGWVHVEIELLDNTQEGIELLYIQMRDEAHNAIGEFVTSDIVPGATCQPSISMTGLSTPTQYQFYPCSATGLREAKTSQGLMMAQKDFYLDPEIKGGKYVHQTPIKKGVHFLWRMSEYWCSRHQKIQPFAMILTKKNRRTYRNKDSLVQMWRKIPNYWLHTNWFGAADIVFKNGGKLDCSELAINDDTGALTTAAKESWLRTSSPVLFIQDNWHPRNSYKFDNVQNSWTHKICQANPVAPGSDDAHTPTFSGRCASYTEKIVSRNTFQGCNTDPNAPEFHGVNTSNFQVYDKYLQEKQESRLQFCNLNCTLPKNQMQLNEVLAYPAMNDTEEDVKPKYVVGKTDPRTKSKVVKLRAGRRYHAITFSFLAFFITPVSVFVSRNYKETFLRQRCYGVHLWYWTHIGSIIATFCLGTSGHAALTPFYRIWGRAIDRAGTMHRYLGYASLGAFLFLVVFGGFRIRAPGIGRKCTMTIHALMGFAHHWLNLAAVVYSTWIPMSPTLEDCDANGMPVGLSAVFFLAVAWTGLDLIFHVVLTVLHIHRDLVIGIRREWYFPIVPLVRNEQMTDMHGKQLRKILFFAYIAIALAMAVVASSFIMTHKMPKHCTDEGTRSCTHIFGCTELAIKYETWYRNHGGT